MQMCRQARGGEESQHRWLPAVTHPSWEGVNEYGVIDLLLQGVHSLWSAEPGSWASELLKDGSRIKQDRLGVKAKLE